MLMFLGRNHDCCLFEGVCGVLGWGSYRGAISGREC